MQDCREDPRVWKEQGKRDARWKLAYSRLFPLSSPKLNFVTMSPSGKEVMEMKLNQAKWNEKLKTIRRKFGDIPIFAFID
ncbi:hypothetical protein J7L18_00660 [Candidatus Bathyarchaeota archaeon]|nr:hypothetical protein [Candidatus Bathyarchaeota archaeon]